MHRFTRAADVHVALMLKYAYEAKTKDNPFEHFVEPSLDTLLSLTDDMILYLLQKIAKETSSSGKLNRLVSQFLRRQIIKEVDTRASVDILEKDFANNPEAYFEHLRKLYKLPENAIICAVPLKYPSPAPNPVDSGAFERYYLFDEDSNSVISTEDSEFRDFIRTISARTETRKVLKIYVEQKYAHHVINTLSKDNKNSGESVVL